jgi:hypothetical protein
MVRDHHPLLLTIGLATLLAAAVRFSQPYSVESPWQRYGASTRAFLGAALRGDSAALARRSNSAATVSWALRAAREHRDSLAFWARYARPWTGFTHDDTATVVLWTGTRLCDDDRLTVDFTGSGRQERIVRMRSDCFDEGP